jgi:hypothetical protein
MSNYTMLFHADNAKMIQPHKVQNTIRLGHRHADNLKVGDDLDLRITPPEGSPEGAEGELICPAVCAGSFKTTIRDAVDAHAMWNIAGLGKEHGKAKEDVCDSLKLAYGEAAVQPGADASVIVFVPRFNDGA